jgi:hypothetical protein
MARPIRPVPGVVRALACAMLWAAPVAAQSGLDGHASVAVDYLPNAGSALEMRARVFAERSVRAGDRLTLRLSGFVEGLIADRGGTAGDAIVRPQDLFADLSFGPVDLTAGFTRVVWGRLDELQPSDVVNPIDAARFFFEGRSEARLPVALVRGRVFLPGGRVLEAVIVPRFRPGRFDQLDEPTSPFNLARLEAVCLGIGICPPPAADRREPPLAWENIQGGARFSTTSGRVDWAVAAYRGLEPFGLFRFDPLPAPSGPAPPPVAPTRLRQVFPAFTMIAADVETVRGEWAVRGEVAAFVERSLQTPDSLSVARGHTVEAGIGVERKAGDYRLHGTVLYQRQRAGPLVEDEALSVIGAAERTLARETVRLRAFSVYDATDESLFLRVITAYSLRDDVWLEGSLGWFAGSGTHTISRFADRDFVYTRLKVYF